MNPQPNSPTPPTTADSGSGGSAILAWLFVSIPLAWGVSQTIIKASALFK